VRLFQDNLQQPAADSIREALMVLAGYGFFTDLAADVANESYRAAEGQSDDLSLAREIRAGYAIKQYLLSLQSETEKLGADFDSETQEQ
jgi:hypothetical protein